MANRFTIASGLASAVGTWDGGASVPVSGDRVLISRVSTGLRTFSTNTAGYAIGATAITLTGSVLAGSYVVGEAVQFGTDPNYYTITAWNNTTKVLTVSALIVAIPAAATVVVCCGHVVTLDGAYEWGDDANTTITVNGLSTNRSVTIAGTLVHSQSVSSSLTGNGGINLIAGGGYKAGTVASPMPLAITATIIPNKSAAPVTGKYLFECLAGARFSMVGANRKRWTTLTAATTVSGTSIQVTDATGWQVGDSISIASDNHGTNTPQYEVFTIAGGYVSGALTVPLSGSIAYAHRSGLPVGNLSSNASIRSYSTTTPAGCYFQAGATEAINTRYLNHVRFDTLSGSYPYQSGVSFSRVDQYSNIPLVSPYASIDSCVFTWTANIANSAFLDTSLGANPYYATTPTITNAVFAPEFAGAGGVSVYMGSQWLLDGCLLSGAMPVFVSAFDGNLKNCWLAQTRSTTPMSSANNGQANTTTFTNCTFSGTNRDLHSSSWAVGRHVFDSCDIGYTFPLTSATGYNLTVGPSAISSLFLNCMTNLRPMLVAQQTASIIGSTASWLVRNRNTDVTQQEDYFSTYTALRENSISNSGVSCISMKPTTVGYDAVRTQQILCAAGASIRVVGYVQVDTAFYNGGGVNWNPPTVTLSGLGITPVVFTASAACNGAWEKYDITATNSSGAGGNLVLSYTTNPKAVVTGTAYFDGVPEAPFITKVRHYGFAFDETSPVRTVNPSVSASEATAAGYSGITIGWGPSTSTVTLTADKTFQYLYDYAQYQSCLVANIPNIPPVTGFGAAGSISLIPNGDVTTTGFSLTGTSSMNMGAYTLTASIPWVYTYTGGTFAQVSTVPSFNGGTLAIGAGGTYTFTMADSMLFRVTPTAPSSYTLSAGSFSGTLTVNNLAAHAITVFVPAGVTTSSAGNTGGAITFSAPIVQQSVTLTNVIAGSRVQIYDTTNNVELFNGTSGYSWTDGSPAVAPRDIRVRIALVSGTTAKQFVEANIGTCGTSAPTNAITYLANQVNDTTYNTNAVDGSLVTGITIVEGSIDRVQISITGGTVAWADIYAYQCFWLFDPVGIQDDGAFITAPDPANYILTGFKIKNTHPSVPLVITGGYGVDFTGSVSVLYDTTGTSIFPAPAHVVPYAVGSGVTAGDIVSIASASATAVATSPATLTVPKFLALKD